MNFIAFLDGVPLCSLRMCPSKFHLIRFWIGFFIQLFISYLLGHLIFSIRLSCFLWKLSSCCSSWTVIPKVLELWSSVLLKSMSYSLTLRWFWMEIFLLFSQMQSSLLIFKALLASLFLFLMSSLSPRRKPSFFIFRHLSVSLLHLFKVIASVFVSLTWRFPNDSIFDTSRIIYHWFGVFIFGYKVIIIWIYLLGL